MAENVEAPLTQTKKSEQHKKQCKQIQMPADIHRIDNYWRAAIKKKNRFAFARKDTPKDMSNADVSKKCWQEVKKSQPAPSFKAQSLRQHKYQLV